MPKKEDNRQHFVRLAEVRTNGVIEWCRKLAKLANKNLYEYTEADINKIEAALNAEVQATISILKGEKDNRTGFTL